MSNTELMILNIYYAIFHITMKYNQHKVDTEAVCKVQVNLINAL